MLRTLSYDFNGTRWVAVAELVPCERGHGHWYPVAKPRLVESTLGYLDRACWRGDDRACWRGDDLAARSTR